MSGSDVEIFEIFERDGKVLGEKPRHLVHRDGDWHKSVQVLVFNRAGELLIQRRSSSKDLYPDLWDYSVGEHLQPGENDVTGALRGLEEELGVTQATLHRLGQVEAIELTSTTYTDRELQQSFTCRYEGPISIDQVEVAEIRWITLDDLITWMESRPGDFTPWFPMIFHRQTEKAFHQYESE